MTRRKPRGGARGSRRHEAPPTSPEAVRLDGRGHDGLVPPIAQPPVVVGSPGSPGPPGSPRVADGTPGSPMHSLATDRISMQPPTRSPAVIDPPVLDAMTTIDPETAMWLTRRMSADEGSKLRRELRRQGWTIVDSKNGRHSKAYPPGVDPDEDQLPFVVLPTTMGEGRGMANLVAQLRRHGFKWKGR